MQEERCSYCFNMKPLAEFSFEHIWPNGLGGDYLPAPWNTGKVCRTCNNIAGRFVDGEFMKSWFGSHERASAARDYRDPSDPKKVIEPPTYMGPFDHEDLRPDEVAEMWIGPAGAHMIHIRPADPDPVWAVYAGGKPTRNRARWGFAFLAFTSAQDYWVTSALLSFEQHFALARRVSLNSNTPPGFDEVDDTDADQARLMRVARSVIGGAKVNFQINVDVGNRLLAKVALGLGREILGNDFPGYTLCGNA